MAAGGAAARRHAGLAPAAAALILLLAVLPFLPPGLRDLPAGDVLPVAERLGLALDWFAREASIGPWAVQDITRGIGSLIDAPIRALNVALADGWVTGAGFNRKQLLPPLSWAGIVGAVAFLGWRLGGPRLALLVLSSGLLIVVTGLWPSAMTTLSSVLLCVGIAGAAGLWLGIVAARRPRAEAAIRAVMNVMQTVPIFSYLIPTLLLFGYGPAAAVAATVIYALPPMTHATVLALRSVPSETRELARVTGCTRAQTLWRVELPVALPQLAIGINQVVMMTLNMVIIASMIGAGGLGFDVLGALRRLDFGTGLEAGLAIVALAVVLDRLTQAAASSRRGRIGRRDLAIAALVLALPTAASLAVPALAQWPKSAEVTVAPAVNAAIGWFTVSFFDPLETMRAWLLLNVMNPFRDLLLALPWAGVVAGLAILGLGLGGPRTGLAVAALLGFVAFAGYWDAAMVSAYLVLLSVALALAVGLPLGLWLARRPRLAAPARLVLDTAQTLPSLVYLLPAVMLFRNGDFSALIAVAAYAVAPAVRYTMEGLAQVPADRIEAAEMIGCTPRQRLLAVELPAALPTIILGLNQTVMMALSMLVIAALVGTRDLGQVVFTALSQGRSGEGIAAGLAIAALALAADALLVAWSARRAAALGLARP